jgi:hypothetical protein
MDEPVTDTGKRQWAKPHMGDPHGAPISHDDILAIEREASDAMIRRLIPFADAIIENMDLVAQGRRPQVRLTEAIEAWRRQTELFR